VDAARTQGIWFFQAAVFPAAPASFIFALSA